MRDNAKFDFVATGQGRFVSESEFDRLRAQLDVAKKALKEIAECPDCDCGADGGPEYESWVCYFCTAKAAVEEIEELEKR